MRPALVLFDIDGTLLITGGASSRCMLEAGRAVFGDQFQWTRVTVGTTDPLLFEELAAANNVDQPREHHAAYRDRYLQLLQAELNRHAERIRVMPGIRGLLDRLAGREDVLTGILTGNYEPAAKAKLRHAGIDPARFDVGVFGEDAADRPGLLETALIRYESLAGGQADRHRVVVVGDTPRDVACAAAGRCRSLAVATGRYTVEQLREAGADCVVEDLADPAPLLAMLGDAAASGASSSGR